LEYEIPVPAITPTDSTTAWQANIDSTIAPEILPIVLPYDAAGSALYATVHNTQIGLQENHANVAASQ
jgi:hypothetical protein